MKATLIAVLLSASLAAAADPVAFEPLPVGDSIHVTFVSTGCFHTERLEFVFERAATLTVKVTRIDQRWVEDKAKTKEPKKVTERVPLGTAILTAEDVAGLDRLFAFYRVNKRGGCTTEDTVTAVHKRGATIQSKETFTDGSCATYEMKGLTLLTAIAQKLEEKR